MPRFRLFGSLAAALALAACSDAVRAPTDPAPPAASLNVQTSPSGLTALTPQIFQPLKLSAGINNNGLFTAATSATPP
ncbi:MAG TPA: hypothetical protein VII66_06095, partial [Gemmatimonadaceae bacterium]